jgi:ferrous iron transport protein A
MTSSQTLPLDLLPHRVKAKITEIGSGPEKTAELEPTLEDLLLGLGFEEGAEIEVRHQGPLGGPLAVNVDGRLVALRPVDAAAVLVEVTPSFSDPVLGS